MLNDDLIIQNMDLSHIHLAVLHLYENLPESHSATEINFALLHTNVAHVNSEQCVDCLKKYVEGRNFRLNSFTADCRTKVRSCAS